MANELWGFNLNDPYRSSVVLGMHMNGTDNGTTFTDITGKTVTRVNAVTKTTIKMFGTSSGYFDGTGDYLTIADNADWNLGAGGNGDFTVEAWVYPTDFSVTRAIVAQRSTSDSNNYWGLRVTGTTGVVQFYVAAAGTVQLNKYTSAAVIAAAWNHVAVTRDSGTTRIFINGVDTASGNDYTSFPDVSTSPLTIGMTIVTTTDPWYGYIDDLRITKGVARYTTNFTPPTQEFPDN